MIEIEKNVPMPMAGRKPKYPFRKMKVGESFSLDGKDGLNAVNAVHTWMNRNSDKTFATRTENGKTRIWCTS